MSHDTETEDKYMTIMQLTRSYSTQTDEEHNSHTTALIYLGFNVAFNTVQVI